MRVSLVALLASLTACEAPPASVDERAPTGGECPSPLPAPPSSVLPALAEFPTAGCEPGAMADAAVEGVWTLSTEDGSRVLGNVGIAARCGTLLATQDAWAEHTADHLAWGAVVYTADLYLGGAFRACRLEEDGSLWGYAASISAFSGNVTFEPFRARPLGWNDGEVVADGLELVSQWAGPADAPWPSFRTMNVRVHGDTAYLVTQEGLRIIDVSDPARPADLGFVPGRRDGYNDVKIIEDATGRVFAVLAGFGAVVIDVSDPGAPREVRRFSPTIRGTHTLFTQEVDGATWAYFADASSPQLGVFDMSEPASPRVITHYTPSFESRDALFHDLFVSGDRVYLNTPNEGLVIVDLSNPAAPRVVGIAPLGRRYSHSNWVTTAGGRTVSVHGDEGRGTFVSIVDVDEASPEFLQTLGEFRMREEVSVHNIMAFGERAYIAYYQNGLRVLDLSDPTQPSQLSYYNTWDPARARGEFFEGAIGVDLDRERGLIFVADTEAGLIILRETR